MKYLEPWRLLRLEVHSKSRYNGRRRPEDTEKSEEKIHEKKERILQGDRRLRQVKNGSMNYKKNTMEHRRYIRSMKMKNN